MKIKHLLYVLIMLLILGGCNNPLLDEETITDPFEDVTLSILEEPLSLQLKEGDSASFTCVAKADEVLVYYSWQENLATESLWKNSEANEPNYTIPSVTLAENGLQFRCLVSALDGALLDTSAMVNLTVDSLFIAPVITSDLPTETTVAEDSTLSLSIIASGTYLHYQWQHQEDTLWTALPDTTATLSIPKITNLYSGQEIRCMVYNKADTIFSSSTTIQVLKDKIKLAILAQPKDVTVKEGTEALFSLSAISDSLITYRWYRAGVMQTSTTNTLSINPTVSDSGQQVYCIVSDVIDTITSDTVILHVEAADESPLIIQQPRDTSLFQGSVIQITFEVQNASTFQWEEFVNDLWIERTNDTQQILNFSANSGSTATAKLRCKVTGPGGSTYTREVLISILTPITIDLQPADQKVYEKDSVYFTISASGAEYYQWQYLEKGSFVSISSATTSKLSLLTTRTDDR